MKRGLIIGGSVVGVIIVVVVAALVIGFGNIDSIVKAGVERYGSEITRATVTLNEVDISASAGTASLSGLVIGNPAGFRTPSAFSLGAVRIVLDVATMLEDKVVIHEIVIDRPQVTYEIGDLGSNIDALRRNIDDYLGKGGKPGAAGGAKSRGGEGDGKKLVIENIRIRGGKVSVSATFLQGRKLSAALPDIHLKDIGKGTGGATPGEAAEKVIAAVSKAATRAVASLNVRGLLPDVGEIAGEATRAMGKKLRDAAGKAGVGDEAGALIEQGAGDIGKALKGLFGK